MTKRDRPTLSQYGNRRKEKPNGRKRTDHLPELRRKSCRSIRRRPRRLSVFLLSRLRPVVGRQGGIMRKENRATMISPETKRIVSRRDGNRCIFCGRYGAPEAHIIRRSQGGLGIPENVVCACRECHRAMDEGRERNYYQAKAERYMRKLYPNWNRKNLTYKKYGRED